MPDKALIDDKHGDTYEYPEPCKPYYDFGVSCGMRKQSDDTNFSHPEAIFSCYCGNVAHNLVVQPFR